MYKVCGLQLHDPVMPRPAADAGAGILHASARERHFCDFNALPHRTYKPLAIMVVLNTLLFNHCKVKGRGSITGEDPT